jgi:hypothetical protein
VSKSAKNDPTRFHVIGLAGPKDSGKDTVGQLLHTHAGFYPIAFADALYKEVAEAYQVDVAMLQQRETKEHPLTALALARCLDMSFVARLIVMHQQQGEHLATDAPRSPRQILRWWGDSYRCTLDPKYWTKRVVDRVIDQRRMGYAHRVVITDVRKPIEVELLRQWGGLLWQIKRPGRETAVGEHVTEVSGAEFGPDTVINNSHDVRHLQQQVLGAWFGHDAGVPGLRVEVPA